MSKKLGERLVDAGLATTAMVDQALQQQKITGHRLGDCLVELGLIQENALLRFLAAEFNTRFVSAEKLAKAKIAPEVLDLVPVRLAENQVVLPIACDVDEKALSVVMAEPQNEALVRELATLTGMENVFAYVGLRSAILAAIRKHYYGDPTAFTNVESGAARREDVSAMAGAFDAAARAESRLQPPLLFDRTKSSLGGTSRSNPTQLREALGAIRGGIGENDYVETLNILVSLLEFPRESTRGHSALLSRHATTVGRKLGLQPRELTQLSIAAYLHDLGKNPTRHLTLAGAFLDARWKAEAKRFARAPVKLFETVHLPAAVNAALAQLYEAYDGTGVPQGAKTEDIALGARIIAAVDSYLELTKNPANPLGRALPKDEALAFLSQHAGDLFDPQVVDALHQLHSGEILRKRLETDGRQVLVADPDEALRTDLSEALTQRSLLVQTSGKLEGAIDAILAGEAEVLVAGLKFGQADVTAVVQFIRVQPECAGLPVVILGEPPDAQARERLIQAGITATVATPVDVERVADTVAGLFHDRVQFGGPGHAVRGSFDELSSLEVLRVLAKDRKSGRLAFHAMGGDAYLQVEEGRVVFAKTPDLLGDAALSALLTKSHADFTYEPESILLEMPHLDRDLELVVKSLERATAS